jgi:hypothetical protein
MTEDEENVVRHYAGGLYKKHLVWFVDFVRTIDPEFPKPDRIAQRQESALHSFIHNNFTQIMTILGLDRVDAAKDIEIGLPAAPAPQRSEQTDLWEGYPNLFAKTASEYTSTKNDQNSESNLFEPLHDGEFNQYL